jgi:hypothetical protein
MRRQSRIFAHQVADPALMVLSDPDVVRLKEESQFTFWMLGSFIANVWGSIDIEPPTVPIFDERSVGNMCWRGLSEQAALQRIFRLAFYHAVHRATREPSNGESATAEHYRKAIDWAVTLQDQNPFDVFDEVCRILRFEMPSNIPPRSFFWKGFLLAFYHVLWQSTYHGLVAAVTEASRKPPYLTISWGDEGCEVVNRSVSATSDKVGGRSRVTHDRRFFQLLEERIGHHLRLEGPDRIPDQDAWTTLIRLKESHA